MHLFVERLGNNIIVHLIPMFSLRNISEIISQTRFHVQRIAEIRHLERSLVKTKPGNYLLDMYFDMDKII